MRTVRNIAEALAALEKAADLIVIFEDWEEGLQVKRGMRGREFAEQVRCAQAKYDNHCHFRAFNEKIDVWWNGDFGVLCEAEVGATSVIDLRLESDTKRHPGMLAFGELAKCKIHTQLVQIGGREGFLRFIKPIGRKQSGSDTQ